MRNGAAHVGESLDGVLRQRFANFHVIVSDNGSTDGTPGIVAEYAAADARIELRRQKQNVGVLENFNGLLEAASTEYFAWLAHDDVWEPGYLERLVALLDADRGAVLAFASFDNVATDGSALRTFPAVHGLAGVAPRAQRLMRTLTFPESEGKANLVYGLVRTETLRRAGGFRLYSPEGWGCDYQLVFRLSWFGHFASVAETLFHKRLTESSGTTRLCELHAYARAYPRMVRELGGSPLLALAVSAAAWRFELAAARAALGRRFSPTHAVRSRLPSRRDR